ncbi:DUF3574 domain-containing protein [Microbulbifer bruguierae]|uniref:DUF3574 domain-containing protein n=1 Tax=Microbulbifer bruguierae TaxID=3029061 RepID=A0ABY8NDP1_9GAMM|nr:DUF3574 domain-containing protein [Microbulbifer bruguierae]WGL15872.1 DUF3574 domain-containing protein [Microbulbifer bruguierae]
MLQLRRLISIAGYVLTGCLLAACASPAYLDCQPGETPQIRDLLYFGTQKEGGFVTDHEWSSFMESVITPRFPEGLTVVKGSGQWLAQNGEVIREPSHILSLIYSHTRDRDAEVAEIIQTYKRQFDQEAVLRVRSRACVSFP